MAMLNNQMVYIVWDKIHGSWGYGCFCLDGKWTFAAVMNWEECKGDEREQNTDLL
jgi:hypothetical protein